MNLINLCAQPIRLGVFSCGFVSFDYDGATQAISGMQEEEGT